VDLSIIIYIVVILVAIISGTNQILTFVERVHKYVKALNERKNSKVPETSTRKINPAQKPFPLPNKLIKGSFRSAMRIPANKNLDVDITVAHPTTRAFKKSSFQAA
jgi:hypothetical protein